MCPLASVGSRRFDDGFSDGRERPIIIGMGHGSAAASHEMRHDVVDTHHNVMQLGCAGIVSDGKDPYYVVLMLRPRMVAESGGLS